MDKPTSVVYCYGAWQDKFKTVKREGIQFHEGVPEIGQLKEWFPKGELFVLDDLMAEGGNDKEVLELFTKHSHHQNITVTNWQNIMDVYRKVTERPFGYGILDLHPASSDQVRILSHLLKH